MVLSAGTPASSITKTGCHDIAEILLKVALNTKIKNQSLNYKRMNAILSVLFCRSLLLSASL
jgi:hypothetical protein